jgi:hypothetical protein
MKQAVDTLKRAKAPARLFRSLKKSLRKRLGYFRGYGADSPELSKQRDADVYVISFPRSGRTWLRLMLGKYVSDLAGIAPKDISKVYNITSRLDGMPTVGFVHDGSSYAGRNLRADELSVSKGFYRGRKVVLLVRDPRDTLVSYYFYCRARRGVYTSDIGSFIRDPRFGAEKAVAFLNIWAANRHVPDGFLLLRYEDIVADPGGQMEVLLTFLGMTIDPAVLKASVEYASFSNMKKMEASGQAAIATLNVRREDESEGYTVRRGQIGGFKSDLSEDDIAYLSEMIDNKLSDIYGYRCEAEESVSRVRKRGAGLGG